MKKLITSVLIGAFMLGGSSPTAIAATTPSPSPASTNPYGAGAIDPAGPNDSILTLSNGSISIKYTMKKLMGMHTTVVSIYEPFVNKRQKFTVIPLADLFSKVKITSSAIVVTKALNDYIYTNKASAFTSAQGYLAIKRNGMDIPYDQGGPIRIIFPDKSSWAKFLDPWNWSLSSISIKK